MSMLTGVLASMGAAPEPPKPATHPSLLAFYEAVVEPDVIGLNTSPDPDRVASWQRWGPDGKVSNTHVLAQDNEPDQPDWDAAPPGLTKPAVNFIASRVTGLVDGDAASLWTPLHDGTGGTIAAIVRPGAFEAGVAIIAITYTASNGPGIAVARQGGTIRVLILDATRTSIFDGRTSSGSLPQDEWSIVVVRFATAEAPDVDIRINRVSELSGDVSGTPSGAPPPKPLHVGYRDDKATPLNAHTHALGFYGSYLSDSEVAEYIEDWSLAELGV